MKKILSPLVFIFFQITISFSQAPEIIWEKGFGGNGDDRARDVIETLDGGFLTIGYSDSDDGDVTDNHGLEDYFVVKTDSEGNLEWAKSYGGSDYDYGYAVCNGIDGGYVLAGSTKSNDDDVSFNHGGSDFWVVKIDALGNIMWERTYGGTLTEAANNISTTSEPYYVLAGYSTSSDGDVTENSGGSDFWIIKIDLLGNLVWESSYGTTEVDHAEEVIQTTDGGYAVAGFVNGWDNTNYVIIKFDNFGELVWSKEYGGTDSDHAYSIIQKSDGGFLCAGFTDSDDFDVSVNYGYYDVWVISIDSLGNLEWEKNYGGTCSEESQSIKIIEYDENEFVFTGRTCSDDIDVSENKGANDYWIVSIDSTGNILWEKTIGGTGEEVSYSIIPISDGNLIVAGWSTSFDEDVTETYSINNYWLVKLGWCTDIYYADTDGDGYGDIASDSAACSTPLGFVTDSTDCNDADNLIYPAAEDICNAIDDNCNGLTDEDAVFTVYFADADGDSYGDVYNDSLACSMLTGYVTDSADCNDADFYIHPDTKEICNFLDDNCNTEIDEGITYFLLYADADGDTFGDAENDSLFCNLTEGFVTDSSDCDDTNENIYPGAPEILNGTDDNCDGKIDEGVGVNDATQNIFSIYPNPTDGNIILTSSLTSYKNAVAEITDITGKILLQQEILSSQQILHTANLVSGSYNVSVKQDGVVIFREGLVKE